MQPGPHNPDIEINAPFIRFKLPDGTWTVDVDANLIKIVKRGDTHLPTQLSAESAVHGAQSISVNIDPQDILDSITVARA